MKKHLLFAALCIALTGAGCAQTPPPVPSPEPPVTVPTPPPTPKPTPAPVPPTPVTDQLHPGTPVPAPIKVSMTAKNFAFSPPTITVTPGQGVTIIFTSVDGTHNFTLPAVNISQNISTGTTINFNAPTTPGSYEYHCAIGSHAELGMKGVLIVK